MARSVPQPVLEPRRFSARQQQVLDALEEIFFAEGLGVTIGELATRASCSRRTLYELAPSKEQLFLLVLDRMMSRTGRAAREAAAAERLPERQLEAFARAGVVAFQPVGGPFLAAVNGYAPASWLFEHHLTLAKRFVIERLEQGVGEGRFRAVHPLVVADALLAAVQRVTHPSSLRESGLSASDSLAALFEAFVHGIVADDQSRSTSSSERRSAVVATSSGGSSAASASRPKQTRPS